MFDGHLLAEAWRVQYQWKLMRQVAVDARVARVRQRILGIVGDGLITAGRMLKRRYATTASMSVNEGSPRWHR